MGRVWFLRAFMFEQPLKAVSADKIFFSSGDINSMKSVSTARDIRPCACTRSYGQDNNACATSAMQWLSNVRFSALLRNTIGNLFFSSISISLLAKLSVNLLNGPSDCFLVAVCRSTAPPHKPLFSIFPTLQRHSLFPLRSSASISTVTC